MNLRSTDTLEIILAGAKNTSDMTIIVDYVDVLITDGKIVENADRQVSASNGVTAATIVSAPTSPAIRRIRGITIYNDDVVSQTVTIQLTVSGTAKKRVARAIAAGKSMIYGSDGKWSDGDGSTTGALTFSGDVSVGGALAVTGNSTQTGNVSVGGTLGVTGATTLAAATLSGTLTQNAANAITAFAGGGQGSATALTKDNNRVTVCASNNDSVKLPAATAGRRIFVKNAAYTLATVKSVIFVCCVNGTWDTNLTA